MSRPAAATAVGYCSGLISDALAHSISPARSRTSSVLAFSLAAAGRPGHDGEFAVQQLPAGVADHPRPEVAQLAVRGGVKRQRLHGADTRSAPSASSARNRDAHLPRRALGEGHRQHLPGGDVTARDELGDAVGDGAGLARSGAGQHADRSARSQHGLALLVVQSGGQWVGDHRHGVHLGSGGRQTGCSATRHSPWRQHPQRGMRRCSATLTSYDQRFRHHLHARRGVATAIG